MNGARALGWGWILLAGAALALGSMSRSADVVASIPGWPCGSPGVAGVGLWGGGQSLMLRCDGTARFLGREFGLKQDEAREHLGRWTLTPIGGGRANLEVRFDRLLVFEHAVFKASDRTPPAPPRVEKEEWRMHLSGSMEAGFDDAVQGYHWQPLLLDERDHAIPRR